MKLEKLNFILILQMINQKQSPYSKHKIRAFYDLLKMLLTQSFNKDNSKLSYNQHFVIHDNNNIIGQIGIFDINKSLQSARIEVFDFSKEPQLYKMSKQIENYCINSLNLKKIYGYGIENDVKKFWQSLGYDRLYCSGKYFGYPADSYEKYLNNNQKIK